MIEVKEGCEITGEQETLGRISYQRFFQRYLMLGGMCGYAETVADELRSVYQLSVVSVPLSIRSRRRRISSRVLQTQKEKWNAIVNRVREMQQKGRPVLIGTRHLSDSVLLGQLLDDAGINNSILNAELDAAQAEQLALAGQAGRVTIATALPGRDIHVALDKPVRDRGGLHVILAERHESSRMDRLFYDQCGRRGDPGSYESITSMEDELLLRFMPGFMLTIINMLWTVSPKLATPMAHYFSRRAQKSVEKKWFNVRKQVLRSEDYLDNVLAFTGVRE